MDAQPVLLVYLRTAGGITGVGEGVVPGGPWWGGESVETMQLIIERYIAPILLGREVDDIVGLGRDIDDVVAANLFVLLLGPEADHIRALVAIEQHINQEADYDEAIEDHRARDQVANTPPTPCPPPASTASGGPTKWAAPAGTNSSPSQPAPSSTRAPSGTSRRPSP